MHGTEFKDCKYTRDCNLKMAHMKAAGRSCHSAIWHFHIHLRGLNNGNYLYDCKPKFHSRINSGYDVYMILDGNYVSMDVKIAYENF